MACNVVDGHFRTHKVSFQNIELVYYHQMMTKVKKTKNSNSMGSIIHNLHTHP